MGRAHCILKDFTHVAKNKSNENNRNLTNFTDMGETFGVVNVLNDQINLNFMRLNLFLSKKANLPT